MAHITVNSTAALAAYFSATNPAGVALTNRATLEPFITAFDFNLVTPLVVSAGLIRFSTPSGVTVSIEGSNFGPITSTDVGQAFSDFAHAVQTLDPNAHANLSRIALTDANGTLASIDITATTWTITSGADVVTISGNLPTNFTQVANGINEIVDPATGHLRTTFDAATSSLAGFGITDVTVSTSGHVDLSLHWSAGGITVTSGDFVADLTGTLPTNLAQIVGIALNPQGATAAAFAVTGLSLTQTSTGAAVMSYVGPTLSLAEAGMVIAGRGTNAADVIDDYSGDGSIYAVGGDDTINLGVLGAYVDGGSGNDTLSLKDLGLGIYTTIYAGYDMTGTQAASSAYISSLSPAATSGHTSANNIENFILTEAADTVSEWTPSQVTNIDLGGGNDYLYLNGGSPVVNGVTAVADGGNGTDTVQIYGNFADGTFEKNADGTYTVTRSGTLFNNGVATPYSWTETLKNFERFVFADMTINAGPSHTTRDFDGSGTTDVLLRNAAGVTYLWTMDGMTVTSGTTTSVQVGPDWQIEAVADFDGNGTADILWAYANAANAADPFNGVSYVSFQNGAADTGGGVVQQLSGWSIAGVGDFTGDAKADVLYRSDTTGQTYLDVMNGSNIDWGTSGFTSAQVTDTSWSVAAVADFDGDGKADVLWRYANAADAADPLNGTLYEWKMDGTSVTSSGLLSEQASGGWQVAGTGDFNGNGTADILFRYENAANASDPLNGITYIAFMNGTTVNYGMPTQWQVDTGWQVASIGDFNSDGKSDILWQQTSTGSTYAWLMDGTNVVDSGFTSDQAGAGWTAQNGVLVG